MPQIIIFKFYGMQKMLKEISLKKAILILFFKRTLSNDINEKVLNPLTPKEL